jgi:hypothetical protein
MRGIYFCKCKKQNSGMVDFNKKKSSKFILNIINKLVNKVY